MIHDSIRCLQVSRGGRMLVFSKKISYTAKANLPLTVVSVKVVFVTLSVTTPGPRLSCTDTAGATGWPRLRLTWEGGEL